MFKSLLTIILLIFSFDSCAQVQSNGSSIFKFLGHLNTAISSALVNGLGVSNLNVFIDVSLFSFAVFFTIRSLLEYNVGKYTFTDLVINKFLFVVLIFSIMDVVFYTYIFDVLESTADDLGTAVQFIFTGFDNFYQLPGAMIFYFLNVTPLTPQIDILNMVFIALIVFIAALLFWKKVLEACIAVVFFYFFSFISFKLVYVFGLIIIPMVLIKELKFIVLGYGKAIAFVFFFSIVWKVMIGICAFLMFTALFRANVLSELVNRNLSMYEFALMMNDQLADGRGISLVIQSPTDVVTPLVLLAVAIALLSMSFQLTQFLLTEFLSVKANFASIQ